MFDYDNDVRHNNITIVIIIMNESKYFVIGLLIESSPIYIFQPTFHRSHASDSLSVSSSNSQPSNKKHVSEVKGHLEKVTPAADERDNEKCGDNDLRKVLLAHGFSLRFVLIMMTILMIDIILNRLNYGCA